jgi:hypothetical protein
MNTLYIRQKKKKINNGAKLLPMLFMMLILLAGFVNDALAQRANLSDWHVPPPLPPGNTTKGNTAGKGAKSSAIVLVLADIPAPQLPKGPAVQLPQLAAISSTAPLVNAPGQPVINSGNTAGVEIPLPAAPDVPSMPQQSVQDATVPGAIDMPDPAAPELPPSPAQRLPSTKATNIKTALPLMPGIIERASLSSTNEAGLNYWLTPTIQGNAPGNMVTPPADLKDNKGIKTKKTKPKTSKH